MTNQYAMLALLHTAGPIPWSEVARQMVSRTGQMCCKRWQDLNDTHTVVKQYTNSIKLRETLMTRFHGRQHLKSTLSAEVCDDYCVHVYTFYIH